MKKRPPIMDEFMPDRHPAGRQAMAGEFYILAMHIHVQSDAGPSKTVALNKLLHSMVSTFDAMEAKPLAHRKTLKLPGKKHKQES